MYIGYDAFFSHDTLYVDQILHDDFVFMSEAKQT